MEQFVSKVTYFYAYGLQKQLSSILNDWYHRTVYILSLSLKLNKNGMRARYSRTRENLIVNLFLTYSKHNCTVLPDLNLKTKISKKKAWWKTLLILHKLHFMSRSQRTGLALVWSNRLSEKASFEEYVCRKVVMKIQSARWKMVVGITQDPARDLAPRTKSNTFSLSPP